MGDTSVTCSQIGWTQEGTLPTPAEAEAHKASLNTGFGYGYFRRGIGDILGVPTPPVKSNG